MLVSTLPLQPLPRPSLVCRDQLAAATAEVGAAVNAKVDEVQAAVDEIQAAWEARQAE